MRPHAANLQFVPKGRNTISFHNSSCSVCHENYRAQTEINSFQVISTFGRRTPTLLHSLSVSPPASIDIDSTPDYAVPIPHNENDEARNSKLSNVPNELKIHELKITPQLKHSLIGVVDRCLDAFAKDDDDLGHTSLVEHTINTGDAPPIKEKLRPLPHQRR